MCRSLLVLLASGFLIYPAQGQDNRKIPISFLPPPLETATYSLGIYNVKSGQLVRRLQEGATQDAFTVGLNGLITNWDGKDDSGKLVPPGKYAARGYAVGVLKVEGVDILGNDWTNDDETLRVARVNAILLVPVESLAVLATMADGSVQVFCWSKLAEKMRWVAKPLMHPEKGAGPPDASTYALSGNSGYLYAYAGNQGVLYQVDDGQIFRPGAFSQSMAKAGAFSSGKNDTVWKIEGGVLNQYSSWYGERLRTLVAKPDEPVPVAVSAAQNADVVYVLEEKPGWQRVRGLSWVETKEENGRPVSTWQTFFERNIRPPDPALGLDGPAAPVEINLVENPLDPGKPQKLKLGASHDDAGSYLTTADGLRLRWISQRANLEKVKLVKGKSANSLTLFQSDGAAWDEFSIEGIKNMMAFDAGEIDMTADGEKTHPEKAAEPPDL